MPLATARLPLAGDADLDPDRRLVPTTGLLSVGEDAVTVSMMTRSETDARLSPPFAQYGYSPIFLKPSYLNAMIA
jgi:hypothetical protein